MVTHHVVLHAYDSIVMTHSRTNVKRSEDFLHCLFFKINWILVSIILSVYTGLLIIIFSYLNPQVPNHLPKEYVNIFPQL